jgi:hypothetical protein
VERLEQLVAKMEGMLGRMEDKMDSAAAAGGGNGSVSPGSSSLVSSTLCSVVQEEVQYSVGDV